MVFDKKKHKFSLKSFYVNSLKKHQLTLLQALRRRACPVGVKRKENEIKINGINAKQNALPDKFLNMGHRWSRSLQKQFY